MRNKEGILSTLIGLLIGGLAYWFQPYNQTSVFGVNMWLILSLGVFIASLFLIFALKVKPINIALPLSLGVIIAVLARIIYDTTFWDATSHNLAPFEILFATLIAFPSSFIGVFLGHFIKKLMTRKIQP
jgi:hypothetical protein